MFRLISLVQKWLLLNYCGINWIYFRCFCDFFVWCSWSIPQVIIHFKSTWVYNMSNYQKQKLSKRILWHRLTCFLHILDFCPTYAWLSFAARQGGGTMLKFIHFFPLTCKICSVFTVHSAKSTSSRWCAVHIGNRVVGWVRASPPSVDSAHTARNDQIFFQALLIHI